jgi:putative Mn2+ efflux pump MntP
MGLVELLIVAIGLSMDAFSVAIAQGLCYRTFKLKDALIIGLYFGVFQALMPVIGYFVGTQFAATVTAIDHWVAFVLLGAIGIKMIRDSRGSASIVEACDVTLSHKKLLTLAVATSIDALAVGVSFAFLRVNIASAAVTIGITTFILSVIGVKVGNVFGARFKAKAELAGGLILIGMGLKILLEHTGIL